MIDEIGNEYFPENIKLANISNDYNGGTEKGLIADFPVEGVFTFSGVNRKVNLLSRLEIYGWYESYHQNVTIQFSRIQMK